jgi:hypothetical protein
LASRADLDTRFPRSAAVRILRKLLMFSYVSCVSMIRMFRMFRLFAYTICDRIDYEKVYNETHTERQP